MGVNKRFNYCKTVRIIEKKGKEKDIQAIFGRTITH
jgi:hypothetical protein